MTREEEGAVKADLFTRKATGYETSLLTGIQRQFNRQRDEVLANVATVQRAFTGQRTPVRHGCDAQGVSGRVEGRLARYGGPHGRWGKCR